MKYVVKSGIVEEHYLSINTRGVTGTNMPRPLSAKEAFLVYKSGYKWARLHQWRILPWGEFRPEQQR